MAKGKGKGRVIGMGGNPQQPPQAQMKLDPTKLWKAGNPKDEGYQMNNGKLGQWFSDRICKGSIPRFKASIPDKNGKYHSEYEEKKKDHRQTT